MTDAVQLLSPAMRLGVPAAALGFMALEYAAARLLRHDSHDWRESAASLGVAAGQNLLRAAQAGLLALPLEIAWRHRLFDIPGGGWLGWLGVFLGVELLYYWQHRASHRIRWFWATHSVHHSSTRMNLTAAIRLGWTGGFSGHGLFMLPLALLGFHPLMILAALGLNLLYQFFIHTELAPRLGPLEWVLNTPAHHRVHHASNPACLDRNFGGVLIVFDRLFGTFAEAPRGEALHYGLAGRAASLNPLRIALGEWLAMGRDAWRARGWRARWRALFGTP